MFQRTTWIGLVLPILFCAAYGLALWLLSPPWLQWFHSEYGPIEIGTALAFLIIAALTAHLTLRLSGAPRLYRAWFALFILGGLFMCLEEISYGQTFFHWESPRWFVEHSKQDETNLHNLFGDKPSSLLRRVAETGLPILGILLPLLFSRHPRGYQAGHFSHYLLPRWEMVAWVVLAALVTPLRRALEEGRGTDRLGETKELLWAVSLLVYVVAMRWRLLQPAQRQAATEPIANPAGSPKEVV